MYKDIKVGDVLKNTEDKEILLITDISNPENVKFEVLKDDLYKNYTIRIDNITWALYDFEEANWIKCPVYNSPLAKALRCEHD